MKYKLVKRMADILVSLAFIPILLPISLLISFLIKFNSEGPVIFKQKRIGLNRRPFTIYKFRTMKVEFNEIEKQIFLGDSNIIFMGNFLRRFKLDELPQFFNILIGDMSIVGPRPHVDLILKKTPAWALKRFDVKPGLTGLSQVSGNIKLTWNERWKFDTYYAKKLSLFLDLQIIFKTLFVLLNGEIKSKNK